MIETSRLILRPLREADLHVLVTELNNFKIARNTSRIGHPYFMDDAREFLNFVQGLDHRSLVSAITVKPDPDQLCGIISYEYKADKNDAELGYWLSEAQWAKGLMTEATRAVRDHAFKVSNLEKLIACYHNDNLVSGRILRNLGFIELGQSKSFSKAQGKDVPVTEMELTRERWILNTKLRAAK
jgi:[ribosomal protein S5]-alanine N-acetyltransferase